jgi:hypothetical protein
VALGACPQVFCFQPREEDIGGRAGSATRACPLLSDGSLGDCCGWRRRRERHVARAGQRRILESGQFPVATTHLGEHNRMPRGWTPIGRHVVQARPTAQPQLTGQIKAQDLHESPPFQGVSDGARSISLSIGYFDGTGPGRCRISRRFAELAQYSGERSSLKVKALTSGLTTRLETSTFAPTETAPKLGWGSSVE